MNRKDLDRLSLIARIRKTEEKLCAQEFSKIRRRIIDIEQMLNDVTYEKMKMLKGVEALLSSSNLDDVITYYNYANHLENEKAQLLKKLDGLRHEEEIKRAELEKKVQRRKIFEHLRDRKGREIENWVNKEVQKNLDDIVAARWNVR